MVNHGRQCQVVQMYHYCTLVSHHNITFIYLSKDKGYMAKDTC